MRRRCGRTMAIWRYRLTKLMALGRVEFMDLLRAQWQLLVAAFLLRVVPRGRLLRREGELATAEVRPSPAVEASARRMALAVSRVAEHGPLLRPQCLVRAVALDRLLRSAGIEAGRIRIGVRLRSGGFEAHAWVELGELVLGDEEWHVRTFTPMTDMQTVLP